MSELNHSPLLIWPDPRLQIVCDPVTRFDRSLSVLLDNMWDCLKEFMGYGLAAPQIGSPARVVIVHTPGSCKIELVNPEIVKVWGGRRMFDEGCLSWPGNRIRVMRHRQIKVKGFDRYGEPVSFGGKELQAACLQHELEHLDGINLADYAEGRRG